MEQWSSDVRKICSCHGAYVVDAIRSMSLLLHDISPTVYYRAAMLFQRKLAALHDETLAAVAAKVKANDFESAHALVKSLLDKLSVQDDRPLVNAAASLLVATKMEDPRSRLRAIVLYLWKFTKRRVAERSENPPDVVPPSEQEYDHLRQQVVASEDELLRALSYRTLVEYPHKFVVVMLRMLVDTYCSPNTETTGSLTDAANRSPPTEQGAAAEGSTSQRASPSLGPSAPVSEIDDARSANVTPQFVHWLNRALAYCNDAVRSLELTDISAPVVACAALLLGAPPGTSLPTSLGAKKALWCEAFGVCEQELKVALDKFRDLYRMPPSILLLAERTEYYSRAYASAPPPAPPAGLLPPPKPEELFESVLSLKDRKKAEEKKEQDDKKEREDKKEKKVKREEEKKKDSEKKHKEEEKKEKGKEKKEKEKPNGKEKSGEEQRRKERPAKEKDKEPGESKAKEERGKKEVRKRSRSASSDASMDAAPSWSRRRYSRSRGRR